MDIEWVRRHCMALPHTTEKVQWGNDLVFKVAGKMYAVAALEPGDHWLSFKCTPEDFAALTERPGVVPAPYMARAQWDGSITPGSSESCRKMASSFCFTHQSISWRSFQRRNRRQ